MKTKRPKIEGAAPSGLMQLAKRRRVLCHFHFKLDSLTTARHLLKQLESLIQAAQTHFGDDGDIIISLGAEVRPFHCARRIASKS
jgi:hypothetical protein